MPNTSATGGVLTPTAKPTNGKSLRDFLQSIIVGVTGLAGDKVRPNWQPNPPPLPDIVINWCGFGIISQRADANPFNQQTGTLSKSVRHEEIDLLCSFYGALCHENASLLRDGLEISQNRESLFLAGMGLVGFSDITHAPDLVNDRYFDRVDITVTIRREIKSEYPVLPFVGAYGTIATETWTRNWSA